MTEPSRERMDERIAEIQQRVDKTSPGPWVYNSYSGIFCGPMMRTYDAWFDTIPDGHTVERAGECPACGDWKKFVCGAPPSPGYGHGCQFFTEDYRRDPEIASVPSHHGDTAIEKRAADADFIANARQDVPWLLEQVRVLRERIRKAREMAKKIECANCDHPAELHDGGRCTGTVFLDRTCGCTWGNNVVDQILAALDGEDEEPPRANGGILPGGVIYQVGESGCDLPGSMLRQVEEPLMPKQQLRPNTGDGRSLPCVGCGITTPDSQFCCGLPYCDNCLESHACDGEERSSETP